MIRNDPEKSTHMKLLIKGIAMLGIVGMLSSCGGGGVDEIGDSRVPIDNFDSGELASGVWLESLGGGISINNGRLVTTVIGSGTQENVDLHFTGDHKYMEATVRVTSTSVVTSGSRGRARMGGYFYNESRGPGSGLPYNGFEGDVWGHISVDLLDDGTLIAKAFIGPEDSTGTTIANYLLETFITSVQLDTDYVMSIEQTEDNNFIFSFDGESFSYQELGSIYPVSLRPSKHLMARIYAGGAGGTVLIEWDDIYINAP